MHKQSETEFLRASDNAHGSNADRSDHVQEWEKAARLLCDSALKFAEGRDQPVPFDLKGFLFSINGMNVLQKPLKFLAQADHAGLLPGAPTFSGSAAPEAKPRMYQTQRHRAYRWRLRQPSRPHPPPCRS